MAVNNNLYPPIVDTYMPAFLINSGDIIKDTCRVYFSLSAYNSLSDLSNAQIIVNDQNTNVSVLNPELYPCGIMLTKIWEDTTKDSNDRYYIDIHKEDIINKNFEINKYYKVQIRFTSKEASNISLNTPQQIDSWLSANLPNFSEWSTVCLVRGISKPILFIRGIDPNATYTQWTAGTADIVGELKFTDETDNERLKSYQIKLYANDELVGDSGVIYASLYTDYNQINYTFNRQIGYQDGNSYRIDITFVTNDLYQETVEYNIIVIQGVAGVLDGKIYATLDENNARVAVRVKGDTVDEFTGNVMIRRASSETNFTIWEDIHVEKVEQKILDFTWYDNTIKSGVWYKYCAQKIDRLGQRSIVVELRDPVMMVFDDMFISHGGYQLKLKFNPQISSYQRTVLESKTDTIGSQFPFIKRNGYTYYRQFAVSGLISHFMDEDGLLISRDKMYEKEVLDLYDEYNHDAKNQISPFNDYTYERDFRDKVEAFLYDNTVKLFRSPTEGNILIKLMNISFTPNQTLGRMIYSFNATAYEIADATIENFELYGIQKVGSYLNDYFVYTEDIFGQINETIPANQDLLQMISTYCQKDTPEGYVATAEGLHHLRLELEGKPQLIKETSGGPIVVNDYIADRYGLDGTYPGFLIYVNNLPIVVPPDGIYELKGENVNITSLYFAEDTTINMAYNATVKQAEDIATAPISENFYTKMGQMLGVFDYNDSLYKKLWNKYSEKYEDHIQTLTAINSLNVEADTGTVIYIKESDEPGFDRHVVGRTQRLDLGDKSMLFEGMYFAGIHLNKASEQEAQRILCPEDKFIDTGISANSIEDIENPIRNGVYNINAVAAISEENQDDTDYSKSKLQKTDNEFKIKINKDIQSGRMIYYNDQWYPFTNDNDVICPVPATIDYCFNLMKGILAN